MIVAAQSATKLGDVLTNPKTVLTWLLASLGVSGAILSMLVPIRESGSMLPQLFISDRVKRMPRRKWVYVWGAIGQGAAVAVMGLAALTLPPGAAGVVLLLALGGFAIARAFCSISAKDVMGRSIPKGFRGRVGGFSNTISGVISAVAAVSLLVFREESSARFLAWMVLGASLLWVVGAGFYAAVCEPESEAEKKVPGAKEGIMERLRLVKRDSIFRRFIVARSLLLGSALASPLLVLLGQRNGASFGSLAGFVVAFGVATASSSFLWGRLADREGRLAMAWGGFVSASVGGATCLLHHWSPEWLSNAITWPVIFLLFNIGYAGVRLGRKTWVVDAADGDKRTDYVSASNTLIAVLVLIIGALNAPLQAWSVIVSLGLYSAFCLVGGIVALRLSR